MTKVLTGLVDRIAISTGVPIGGIWLLILTIGGASYLVSEYPGYTQADLAIGVVMWAIAYCVLWFGYGAEFWMASGLLEILRKLEREELDDEDNSIS